MGLGVPMWLILTPISWWVLMRCYPPEMPTIGDPEELRRERIAQPADGQREEGPRPDVADAGGLDRQQLDPRDRHGGGDRRRVVFLPGINLLTWPRAQRSIGWDALMLIGGVPSLGAAAAAAGLAKYWLARCPTCSCGRWRW